MTLPGEASGFAVGARWHLWVIRSKFNFKGFLCLSFYLFKKWTFVKSSNLDLLHIKVEFKQYLCIYLKIIKAVMDFSSRYLPSSFQLFCQLHQYFISFCIFIVFTSALHSDI